MADGWENSIFFVNSATGWSRDDVQLKFADVASASGAIPADVAIAAFGGRALVEIGIRETIQAARRCTPRHAQRLMNRIDLPQYRGMRYASLELINGAAPVHPKSDARERRPKAST